MTTVAKLDADATISMPGANIAGTLADARVLVVGLGRFGGGIGVTRWLAAQGARVTVTDEADAHALEESLAEIEDLGVRLRLGGHHAEDLTACDLVVVNPAVMKGRSKFFAEIVRRGVPRTTEMNLFCERCPAPIIGVTGTFGKSTTSAMIAAALEGCRVAGAASFTKVHFGGNIGVSLLPELHRIAPTDVVVLEMSNAQLEDLPTIDWSPFGAVLTNLIPHHLDRYDGSFDAYIQAKFNLLRRSDRTQWFIRGAVHEQVETRVAALGPFRSGEAVRVPPLDAPIELRIPGDHNQTNAACALAVCRAMGLPEATARAALADFRGLPHRLEFVRTLDGVDYYNDSKSTAPSATIVALRSLDRPVICIVGGQAKPGIDVHEFATALRDRSRAVVCVGESRTAFGSAIRERGVGSAAKSDRGRGIPSVHEASSLDEAVPIARNLARPGDVVLLSPGAPSFDAYKNFVQRGEHFVSLVIALA